MTGDRSPETNAATAAVSAEKPDAFRWHIRPSDKSPLKLGVIAAVALFVLAAGTILFGNLLLGVLGFAIILASTAEYWLGTSYRVDAKGASRRCGLSVTSMEWGEVKRAQARAEGILLSPLSDPNSRLNEFRGVFLRYGEEDAQTVAEAVQQHLPNDVRLLEG